MIKRIWWFLSDFYYEELQGRMAMLLVVLYVMSTLVVMARGVERIFIYKYASRLVMEGTITSEDLVSIFQGTYDKAIRLAISEEKR